MEKRDVSSSSSTRSRALLKIFGTLAFLAAYIPVTAIADVPAAKELRFAITGAVAADPSFDLYKELTDYVAAKAGRKSVFISGLSYGDVDNLFVDGNVDVGFLCNCHYARRRDVLKFEPIAAPVIKGHGKPKFKIYVIVNKDSGIKSLDDLRGKTVDMADQLSTTSIYAAYALLQRNETMKSFFGKTIYSGSHVMTVQLVANKLVDAGFIDSHIWDYLEHNDPAYSSRTRVILSSSDFTIPPVVVSKMIDPALKKKIRQILLSMHKDSRGMEILSKLRIEKFIAITDKDYQDVVRMYRRVKDRL